MTEFVAGQRVTAHAQHRLHLDPEWVVVGVRMPNGECAALAGVGLTHATLTARARWVTELAQVGASNQLQELHAEVRGFHIGFGGTYADALVDLSTKWSPDAAPA